MTYEDNDLRERFSALARDVGSATPFFDRDEIDVHRATLEARRARLARYSVASLTTLAAAAVIAIALWTEEPDVPEAPSTHWVAPTDFLLRTSADLLSPTPNDAPTTDLGPTTAADVRRDTSGE